MPYVGTLAWVDRTGGRLTAEGKLHLLGQLAPTVLGEGVRLIGWALGIEPRDECDPEELAVPIPRTSVTAWAEALCASVSDPFLLAHCHRTYLIGALLGRGRSLDRELFYAAAMLHDVGLTPTFGRRSTQQRSVTSSRASSPCFAVRGADVAMTLADAAGWTPHRSMRLGEAISLHINVRVPRSQGVEAHLLNASSALDVLRLGEYRIPGAHLEAIRRRWPRGDDFCAGLATAWESEASEAKKGRAAFLSRCGFEWAAARFCDSDS
jgi:hypothetical protein